MEAPGYLQSNCCPPFNSDNMTTSGEHFMVDDLLDFSNDDGIITEGTFDSVTPSNVSEGSTVTAADNSCNSSSFSGCEPNFADNIGCCNLEDDLFSGGLGLPYDDLADELEWLSNFVEESFSREDLQKLQLISGMETRPKEESESRGFKTKPNRNNPSFNPELSVPAKARSKRSRAPPCNWGRLLVVPSTALSFEPELIVPSPQSASSVKKPAAKTGMHRKKDSGDGISSDGRRCLHCATDKTPQWRTGPMGPKTLCNACGVRYKSGRLVPEYRPAASPTFVLTKHSNSHRKVMELRRQNEIQPLQLQNHHPFLEQEMMFDASHGDEYLIPNMLVPISDNCSSLQ